MFVMFTKSEEFAKLPSPVESGPTERMTQEKRTNDVIAKLESAKLAARGWS